MLTMRGLEAPCAQASTSRPANGGKVNLSNSRRAAGNVPPTVAPLLTWMKTIRRPLTASKSLPIWSRLTGKRFSPPTHRTTSRSTTCQPPAASHLRVRAL
jgi:hypothetical protein